MSAFKTLVSLALLVSARLVQASVYVTNPVQSTVCHAGQSCQVEWVDDGQSPLLSDIGECTVGLYNGEMLLAQSLTSVNVADSHSFTFTPDASAGGNGGYYLVFTSTSGSYQGWSGTFTLDGMTGTSGSGSSTSSSTVTSGSSTFSGGSTLSGSATLGGGSSTESVLTSTAVASTFTSNSSTSVTATSSISASTLSAPSTVSSSTSIRSSSATSAAPSSTSSSAAIRTGASTSLAGGLVFALAGALVF